ncbi:zinc metalloproteinase nas-6 [Caerostris darwini]|uniref:Metalloendopeptidase n=1 Tax=Caerostris darwini TaxID=1538125 RepID=A0AAV4UBX1_9ARAC|nr:zinc metalloproteinase nas-6 [Caerostris darwini]
MASASTAKSCIARMLSGDEDDCCVVHYVIDRSLSNNRKIIERAMDEIERYSRIEFMPRKGQKCHLLLTKDDGCYYYSEDGCFHRISLGMGCAEFGTILHELMHALGFEHEHNRPDRGKYLIINWRNIQTDEKDQFKKVSRRKYIWNNFPMDFDSIMMYAKKEFTKNGLPTIARKDGGPLKRANKLSAMDKEKLAKL